MCRAAVAGLALCLLAAPGARSETAEEIRTQALRAAARALVDTEGIGAQISQTADLLHGRLTFEIAQKAPRRSQKEITRIVDETILPEIRARLDELEARFVDIYAANYSLEDMKGLRAFYESPLGQRFLRAQPMIAVQSADAGDAWGKMVINDVLAKNADALRRLGIKR